jgi:uncharacterized membrane protein YraQ (UPF0718 family)
MLEHTLHDTWLMFPLLFLSYVVIDYFERKGTDDDVLFRKLQNYGPLVGALIGIIPQCGFSIIAAMLFINRNISLGTMLAVFIATSDEAIPVLLANPSLYNDMLKVIILKIVLGIVVGYLVDKVLYPKQKLVLFSEMEESDEEYEEDDEDNASACPCCYTEYPLVVSALLRSLKIFAFLFATSFVLNIVIHEVGEATLSKILLNNSIFQPVLASLFGFIPNTLNTLVVILHDTEHSIAGSGLCLHCNVKDSLNRPALLSVVALP